MSELLPIVIFALICAALSHIQSGYDPIACRYERKERLFYAILTVGLIVFAGLRTYYNDTHTYRASYMAIPEDTSLTEGIDWFKTGNSPGFIFVMRVLRRLNVSTQSFTMLFSAFTIGVNLWFIRKYTCNIFMTVFLFITFAGFTFNLAAIKQCTAMALCMIATDRAIRKKYVQFVLFILLGCLFHAYSFMYLIIPLLCFRPWSKYTVIMIVLSALAGLGLQSMVGTILNVSDMLGSNYDASSFTGEGVNPLRLLAVSVPVVLSLMTREQIEHAEERDQYIILNATMLNAELMFVGLFGTANYFARLANYFLPFQAVAVPWLLNRFDANGKRTLSLIAVVCYALFFIYSNAISESFDVYFNSMSLWTYLRSVFSGVPS